MTVRVRLELCPMELAEIFYDGSILALGWFIVTSSGVDIGKSSASSWFIMRSPGVDRIEFSLSW